MSQLEGSYREIESADEVSQTNNNMANIKRLLIIGAAIALVIVVATIILVLVLNQGGGCRLNEVEPRRELTNLANIRATNNLALFRFAGYLEMVTSGPDEPYEIRYLPLDLKDVTFASYANQNFVINMDAGCARIELNMQESPQHMYQVSSLIVESKTANTLFKRCRIYAGSSFTTNSSEHYKCLYDRCFDCPVLSSSDDKSTNLSKVRLIMNQFEFEVYGNAHNVSKAIFSKKVKEC